MVLAVALGDIDEVEEVVAQQDGEHHEDDDRGDAQSGVAEHVGATRVLEQVGVTAGG